jgi:hypothetical protein
VEVAVEEVVEAGGEVVEAGEDAGRVWKQR